MVTTLPGLSVSISRDRIVAAPQEPIEVSGRVTAFGLGVPALIVVRLEQAGVPVQTETTFASPTGDYTVIITPEEGGDYVARAQAFPPFPGVGQFLPPLAGSAPAVSTVEELPEEVRRRVAEITVPVTVTIPAAPTPAPPVITLIQPAPTFAALEPAPEPTLLPVIALEPTVTGRPSGRIVAFVLE